VDAAARGLTVQCPLCSDTFVAVPEAKLVAPGRTTRKNTQSVRTRSRDAAESPRSLAQNKPSPSNEDDHDPHRHPSGGLPASVLMGLALLPFAIPILWLIAPIVFGQPPMPSVVVPLAIAISASILSLAVIYTIDWSPQLRVKGVLILVGMAYFVSVSLYFLKPEMVDWAKTFLGRKHWTFFSHPEAPLTHSFIVSLPKQPERDAGQPIHGLNLDCFKLTHKDAVSNREFVFVVAVDLPQANGANGKDRKLGSDAWYKNIIQNMLADTQGQPDPDVPEVSLGKPAGQQFGIKLPDNRTVRIVHIYVFDGRVYYLSIEGVDLKWGEEYVHTFFSSFHLAGAMK
jgi:hypothetical protein